MNNGKMFDYPPKCPGLLTSKLSGLFGWRHTYRVHHRQKGLDHNHFHSSSQNLHKTYSLNLPPKKHHEITASNPSLPEASSSSSSSNTTATDATVNDPNCTIREFFTRRALTTLYD